MLICVEAYMWNILKGKLTKHRRWLEFGSGLAQNVLDFSISDTEWSNQEMQTINPEVQLMDPLS